MLNAQGMKRFVTSALGVAILAAFVAGCSHVKPWQREHMARIETQLERTEPNRDYEDDMWSVREAALGGGSRVGGGGCGCN